MRAIKNIFFLFLITIAFFVLSGCHSSKNTNSLKVGTIAGPESELMETAEKIAHEKYGLSIEIIPFTDYVMPNEALADGSIDANVFQHQPYLDATIAKRGYKIVAVGKTFIYPMGIYSKKIKSLNTLASTAVVAIPNDPSNETRALLLLQSAGLITLKANSSATVTLSDVINNPKLLKIKEIDASQLPRIMPDVDIAVINTNYAMLADLLPSRDALFLESKESPYANIVVVRQGDESKQPIKELLDALHSPEVMQKAEKLFKGQAIPAWQ